VDMCNLNSNVASPGVSVETRSPGEQVRTRFRTRKQKGQSLVEFALVMPLLLLVVTGIAAFGIYLNNYMALTDAVSTGARLLAINRGQTTDPCALTVLAVENAAPFLAPANLTFKFVFNTTAYSGTSCSSSTPYTGAASHLVAGQPATVTVTYPCNLAVYGTNYMPSCTFTAQTTEIVQ